MNDDSQNKPKPKFSDCIIPLYQEQWIQIRHLDSLDFRNMTLLPVVVGVLAIGSGYLGKTGDQVPGYVTKLAAIIVFGLSFCGCYTTFRNWLCYMRRLSILTSLENEMGLAEKGIIRKSIQFIPPQTYISFNWSLLKSIRFPLTAFYAVLGGCAVMIYNLNSMCRFLPLLVVISIFIFFYCNIVTYCSLRREFQTDSNGDEDDVTRTSA